MTNAQWSILAAVVLLAVAAVLMAVLPHMG